MVSRPSRCLAINSFYLSSLPFFSYGINSDLNWVDEPAFCISNGFFFCFFYLYVLPGTKCSA